MIDQTERREPITGFLAVLTSAFWSARYAFARPTPLPEAPARVAEPAAAQPAETQGEPPKQQDAAA